MALYKQYILILLLLLGLQGCVSTAMSGASVIYDRYNLQHQLQDHQIAIEIENNIKADPLFSQNNASLQADCFDYQVLLTGATVSEKLRQRAAIIAANTHDVKHVYNFIRIGSPYQTETIHDMWLTSQIKGEIIAQAKMNPDNIKVVTDKGTVYLMGRLTHKQADEAVNIARYTPGVKHVIKILKYINYSQK